MSEFEFDPDTYLDLMAAEVPAYRRLQGAVVDASTAPEAVVTRILDLGTGTGETLAAVLDRHPRAVAVGVDKNPRMLDAARRRLEGFDVELEELELVEPLPEGPYDLVVSALAVHHLLWPDKAALFERVAAVLVPGGRFVLGDVVVPDDPGGVVTPVTDDHDHPDTAADQLEWLAAAGLAAEVTWCEGDLVVFRADRAT